MLGLTTYEESLRTIGKRLDPSWVKAGAGHATSATNVESGAWTIEEDPAARVVRIRSDEGEHVVTEDELARDLLHDRALRGTGGARTWLSDVLRTIGGGLDALNAASVYLELGSEMVAVRCTLAEDPSFPVEIAYADDDLGALREAAVAHRNGTPLWRVLILHGEHASAAALKAPLVAECSVEVRPYLYGRALHEAPELPDLVVAYVAAAEHAPTCAETLRALRASPHSSGTPILLVLEQAETSASACEQAADETLRGPVAPATLRSRVRALVLARERQWDGALDRPVPDSARR